MVTKVNESKQWQGIHEEQVKYGVSMPSPPVTQQVGWNNKMIPFPPEWDQGENVDVTLPKQVQ